MIRLFDYLNESIFDDEEKHMDDMENKIYNELLKGSDFVVGTDKKTIVYDPKDEYSHGIFDRRLSLGIKGLSDNPNAVPEIIISDASLVSPPINGME